MAAGGVATQAATMTPMQLLLEAGAGAAAATSTPGLAVTGGSLSMLCCQSGMWGFGQQDWGGCVAEQLSASFSEAEFKTCQHESVSSRQFQLWVRGCNAPC